jgi:tetratricopeptide (TPR) repeat protein
MVKQILKIVVLVLIIIVMVYLKLFINQYREFNRGEEAYSKKNFKDAVVYYETSIQFYTPFSSNIKKAIQRMFEIASIYEQEGNYEYALDVYENLRSALYATKSFYQPYSDVINRCDKKITELLRILRQ